jgi:hypothetical protein
LTYEAKTIVALIQDKVDELKSDGESNQLNELLKTILYRVSLKINLSSITLLNSMILNYINFNRLRKADILGSGSGTVYNETLQIFLFLPI